jgi:hypothetical protein
MYCSVHYCLGTSIRKEIIASCLSSAVQVVWRCASGMCVRTCKDTGKAAHVSSGIQQLLCESCRCGVLRRPAFVVCHFCLLAHSSAGFGGMLHQQD